MFNTLNYKSGQKIKVRLLMNESVSQNLSCRQTAFRSGPGRAPPLPTSLSRDHPQGLIGSLF